MRQREDCSNCGRPYPVWYRDADGRPFCKMCGKVTTAPAGLRPVVAAAQGIKAIIVLVFWVALAVALLYSCAHGGASG